MNTDQVSKIESKHLVLNVVENHKTLVVSIEKISPKFKKLIAKNTFQMDKELGILISCKDGHTSVTYNDKEHPSIEIKVGFNTKLVTESLLVFGSEATKKQVLTTLNYIKELDCF